MPHVVCTSLNSETGPHLKIFADAGFTVSWPDRSKSLWVEDNLIAALKEADAVVAGSEPYTPRVIGSLPRLRAIARSGVGFDAVNLEACDKANIPVCTTPGVNHHSVAEHTIALLMGVARGFPGLDRKVRVNDWRRVPFPRVMGRTLGLMGLGRIGQAVATRGIGLGMKVIAYDPFPNRDFVQKHGIELVDLDTILARSDFLSLHLPMNADSINIINKKTLAKMKRGAVLINTARGQLVQEDDLYDALKSGQLGGAGLDVFQVEPLPLTSKLLELDNLLVSGHVAGLDNESAHDTSKMYGEIIVGLYQGRWPEGCVQNLKGVTNWKW